MIDIDRLKAIRGERQISQSGLAKAAGVSQQLIGEIERGAVRTTKHIYRIAKALNVPASDLDTSVPKPAAMGEIESQLAELDDDDRAYVIERLKADIAHARKRGIKLSKIQN